MGRFIRTISICVFTLAWLSPSFHASALASTTVSPTEYYLALGDSLTYGYQPNHDSSHGLADDILHHLQVSNSSFVLQNLACPAETSRTFVNGGCPFWYARKTFYLSSQLSAAMSFIRSHSNQLPVVTIDLGAVDVLTDGNASTCATKGSITTVLANFDSNFKYVLGQLKSALKPGTKIATMNYYDPLLLECASNPEFLQATQALNAHVAQDAQLYGVPVADVYTAFGGANANICGLTWMCTSSNDIHPNNAGYAVIATALESALGV